MNDDVTNKLFSIFILTAEPLSEEEKNKDDTSLNGVLLVFFKNYLKSRIFKLEKNKNLVKSFSVFKLESF